MVTPTHFLLIFFQTPRDPWYRGLKKIKNNNNNHDDAVIMTEVIAGLDSVHLVNKEQRQAAADQAICVCHIVVFWIKELIWDDFDDFAQWFCYLVWQSVLWDYWLGHGKAFGL